MEDLTIDVEGAQLPAYFGMPDAAPGMVVFAHGRGSSRESPRNNAVAEVLREAGLGTMLFNLLTEAESGDMQIRSDMELHAQRLLEVSEWLQGRPDTKGRSLGYFGSSTGAAAALLAASRLSEKIAAVVSRGGRADLVSEHLDKVRAATLLIVGEHDEQVLDINRKAHEKLRCETDLAVVAGAGHLFEEPGKLDEVARLTRDWFLRHLK